MASGNELCRDLGINFVRFRDQWCQELDYVRGLGPNGIENFFINVIRAPQVDHLLDGFVGFQRV